MECHLQKKKTWLSFYVAYIYLCLAENDKMTDLSSLESFSAADRTTFSAAPTLAEEDSDKISSILHSPAAQQKSTTIDSFTPIATSSDGLQVRNSSHFSKADHPLDPLTAETVFKLACYWQPTSLGRTIPHRQQPITAICCSI